MATQPKPKAAEIDEELPTGPQEPIEAEEPEAPPEPAGVLVYSVYPHYKLGNLLPQEGHWATDGRRQKWMIDRHEVQLNFRKNRCWVAPEHLKAMRGKPGYGYQYMIAFMPMKFKDVFSDPKDATLFKTLRAESLAEMMKTSPKRAEGFINQMVRNAYLSDELLEKSGEFTAQSIQMEVLEKKSQEALELAAAGRKK